MNRPLQPGSRPSPALRPALIALAASVAAIGSIVVLSNDDPAPADTAAAVTVATTSPLLPPESSLLGAPVTAAATAVTTSPAVATPLDTTPLATTPVTTATTPTTSTGPATTTAAPPAVGVPVIRAKAYAVYDVGSKQYLAESQADAPLPVGSIMKLLTAYLVLQAGDLNKLVTVPQLQVNAAESAIGLRKGEQLARDVLFRAMLIVSANDAAQTLAIDIGGSSDAFVQQMNAAAQQLGLTNTVAANPIGLDAAGAHSSAHDVISLAAKLMQNDTFRQAVAKTKATLHGKNYVSTDKLLTTYPGANGVKTGHTTQAGYCVVSSATRNGRTIMVAVLGAPSEAERFSGAKALLDWAFAQHP